MTSTYQVLVRDYAFNTQAIITDWRTLNFVKNLNELGSYTISLNINHPAVQYFVKDAIIEVRRKTDTIEWYTEFIGLHRTPRIDLTNRGNEIFTSYGRDLMDLLRRKEIEYFSGSAQASKSGPGDTVACEFVNENCGTLAVAQRQHPLITVNSAAGIAPTWTGERAWQNVLTVLQDINRVSGIDYEVYSALGGFYFRTKYPQLGDNRTTSQTVVPPVIFSTYLGNMTDVAFTRSATEEVTALLVLGQGANDERVITEVLSPALNDSPFNRIERTYDANQENTIAGLQSVGERKLQELQEKNSLEFTVLQIPSCEYNRHYFFGDIVSVRVIDTVINQQLSRVEIGYTEGKETLKLDFKDPVGV